MPDVIDGDDLVFALVRARYLQPPRQVADGLADAAATPGALAGVTPAAAQMQAAEVLRRSADPPDQGTIIAILRDAVRTATPAQSTHANTALAVALAESGDPSAAGQLAAQLVQGLDGRHTGLARLLALTLQMALTGYFDEADSWLAAVQPALEALPRRSRGRDQSAPLLALTQRQVGQFREEAAAAGIESGDSSAMLGWRRSQRTEPAVRTEPPWPAVAAGRLLWWPEAEYRRVLRQVPALAAVLADPWRAHTRLVELTLRADAGPGRGARRTLVAASVEGFADFLDRTRADPRQPATMTAFGAEPTSGHPVQPWPPKPRDGCWCASGRRYADCCGHADAKPGR